MMHITVINFTHNSTNPCDTIIRNHLGRTTWLPHLIILQTAGMKYGLLALFWFSSFLPCLFFLLSSFPSLLCCGCITSSWSECIKIPKYGQISFSTSHLPSWCAIACHDASSPALKGLMPSVKQKSQKYKGLRMWHARLLCTSWTLHTGIQT